MRSSHQDEYVRGEKQIFRLLAHFPLKFAMHKLRKRESLKYIVGSKETCGMVTLARASRCVPLQILPSVLRYNKLQTCKVSFSNIVSYSEIG